MEMIKVPSMAWNLTKFLEIKTSKMQHHYRKGYENYSLHLESVFGFLSNYNSKTIEERTDGSFYTCTIQISHSYLQSIRIYHEFIEQQLIVTLKLGNDFQTTIEFNRKNNVVNENDLKPNGDDYLNALTSNAEIIKLILQTNPA